MALIEDAARFERDFDADCAELAEWFRTTHGKRGYRVTTELADHQRCFEVGLWESWHGHCLGGWLFMVRRGRWDGIIPVRAIEDHIQSGARVTPAEACRIPVPVGVDLQELHRAASWEAA